MIPETPRLRMFVGPNGSGKSVLKFCLPEPLGVHAVPEGKIVERFITHVVLDKIV